MNKRYDNNEEKIGNNTYTYNDLLSKRRLFEKENKQTYSYHKRKWNKKVTSTSETGTKQIFAIFIDEHVALVRSVCSGSTPIIMMVQYFTVFLILSVIGGSLGTPTSPQQQNTANSKDLCEVWKNNTVFLIFLADFSGSEWKKTLHKKRLLWSIYSRLPVTRSNFHFPSNRFLYNVTLDNSNSRQLELCSVSLEGSNYRESTVPFKQFIS